MKPGIKALLVIVGTMAFFLIPIAGPALSSVGNWAVQRAFGVDDDTAVAQRNKDKYRVGEPLQVARDCCEAKCGLDWDHALEECGLDSAASVSCFETCGPAKVDPNAVPPVLTYGHE